MNTPLGLIATTVLDIEPFLSDLTGTRVVTRYGDVPIRIGRLAEVEIAVVRRHGGRHPLPPGQVNYRAYTLALRDMGVTRVLSTVAVGSLRADIPTGTFVSLDQFLDFTKHRAPTLFDESGFAFTDMSRPYCSVVRRAIASAAGISSEPVSNQDVRDARAQYAKALKDVVVGALCHMRQLSDTQCDCPPRSDIQMP